MLLLFAQGSLNWQFLSITIMNGLITLITIFNALFLHFSLPETTYKEHSKLTLDDAHKIRLHIAPSSHKSQTFASSISIITRSKTPPRPFNPKRLKLISNDECIISKSLNKSKVIKFFSIIAWIPLFISYVSFFCALFPKESIWTWPFINILCGFMFISFIQLLIISCDGWFIVQHYLEPLPDIGCVSQNKHIHKLQSLQSLTASTKRAKKKKRRNKNKNRCCLRANAFIGLKWRMNVSFCIFIKPILNYFTLYFQYYYQWQLWMSIALGVFTVISTVVCIQMMNRFIFCCIHIRKWAIRESRCW